MNENNTSRLKNIDILKAICSFMVVCIHIPFPGMIGQYITAITRIAVPIFFMITGYFYSDIIKKGGESRQIKKIATLTLEANLIYLVWECCRAIVKHNTNFLTDIITKRNMFKLLLFNESPLSGHLWYFGAILYVLVIVYVIDKLHCRRLLYWITPVLLAGDLVFGKYALIIWNREFPYVLVRNFFFVGIPYFCIGCMIKDKKKILERLNGKILLGLIMLFVLAVLLERFILVSINMNATRDHYFSTTLLAVGVFNFALKYEGTDKNIAHKFLKIGEEFISLLILIGQKYSTWIYILHPIFISCIGFIGDKAKLYNIYKFIAPVAIYTITLTFLMFIDKGNELIKQRY